MIGGLTREAAEEPIICAKLLRAKVKNWGVALLAPPVLPLLNTKNIPRYEKNRMVLCTWKGQPTLEQVIRPPTPISGEEEEVERDKDAGPTTTANEKEDVTSEGEDACSRIVTTNNGDGTTPKSLTEDGEMIGTKLGNDTEVEPDLAYVQVVL